ncbi:MAG TPA: bifunctional molybdenum cofactor biosynthesis protein MoaC/MoaB [Bacteroidota bacterium]
MFDITKKSSTLRSARARAVLTMKPSTIAIIRKKRVPKGDPIPVAKVAAIQAAKNTSQIIPYCHPLPLTFVGCEIELKKKSITITTEVKAIYPTGVEMEALTAATVAALTLYDMLKQVDDSMIISDVRLEEKRGGKSDFIEEKAVILRAAVLVTSDSISSGKKTDQSGKMIVERLKQEGIAVASYDVIADDPEEIQKKLITYSDTMKVNFVLTTGGTGFSKRDFSPEATAKVIEREIPGIPEALRAYGQERTPYSMLSRGIAGLRGNTIIVNLPGSKRGVADSLDALFPALLHSVRILAGGGHPEKRRKKK